MKRSTTCWGIQEERSAAGLGAEPGRYRSPFLGTPACSDDAPALRVVLYSHDTMGLGHVRRNLLIAQALADSHLKVNVMLITGTRAASAFTMPPGVDCLTLPSLYKESDGQYRSRHLNINLKDITDLRAKTILGATQAFKPDVMIVDNVPRGAVKELDPTLEYLRKNNQTQCILGLRDILDDPDIISREWLVAGNMDVIRSCYDAVWVYGDPAVFDLVKEHNFPADVSSKIHFTGYFDQRMRLKFPGAGNAGSDMTALLPQSPFALCLVGGGQDGAKLAEAFSRSDFPAGTCGVLVTGPFMPLHIKERIRLRAAKRDDLHVLDFVTEPVSLIQQARSVITMGGYNTVSEVLSFEKRALVVPRVKPRREQLIRAEHLGALGAVDVLLPENLTPCALTEWLLGDENPSPQRRSRIDLNGLSRLPVFIEELIGGAAYPAAIRARKAGGIRYVIS